MEESTRIKTLRFALVATGLVMAFGLYPLMTYWSDAWTWEPRQSEYEQMMMGVYAVLGLFLLVAARNPMAHKSLIWFAVWSSLVHGVIMLVQALVDPVETPNLYGDVPALLLIAVVLGLLMPRGQQ